jgi:hypothetical protein
MIYSTSPRDDFPVSNFERRFSIAKSSTDGVSNIKIRKEAGRREGGGEGGRDKTGET